MKIRRVVVPVSLNLLLILSFISTAATANRVLFQSVTIKTYHDIPEAEGPCTLEECEWWKQIREAGNDLQRKGDKKSRARFLLLLSEGQRKAYHVPLADRPVQVLESIMVRPMSDVIRREKIDGTVVLSVEFRADGSVGDVKMIEGRVGWGLDEGAARAARQAVFLPAVSGGTFVTSYLDNIKYKFSYKRD